ncbi:MAG: hypothetical protein IKN63_00830 [Bacilli bacterium]|nr:hypothetical protein [Bacilli bacterium]
MNKDKLRQARKRLIALGILGVMMETSGCGKNNPNEVPSISPISSEYYDFNKFYKYAVRKEKAVKLYKGENIYLLYNKEDYSVNEYIFANIVNKFGGELYDLETEKLLCYGNVVSEKIGLIMTI